MIHSPMIKWLRRYALCAAVSLAISARISAQDSSADLSGEASAKTEALAKEGTEPAAFQLRDFLGHEWRNECVEFPLTSAQSQHATAGHALLGTNGQSAPYQLVADPAGKGAQRIAFLADLDPFETRVWQFTNLTAKAPTDLRIEETADVIRLLNDHIGIAIRKAPATGEGPIEAIRLASGKWVGGSQLVATNQALTAYTAEITARGPVYVEVVCQALFDGTNQWSLTFRLQAREPVALVDEQFALGDQSQFVVSLGRAFAPDSIFSRPGGEVKAEQFAATHTGPVLYNVFVWQPWLQWWLPRHGKWFGLYNAQSPDLLMLGARDAEVWVDPTQPRDVSVPVRLVRADENVVEADEEEETEAFLVDKEEVTDAFLLAHDASAPVRRDGADVVVSLPLLAGQRRWMLGAFSKEACLAILKERQKDTDVLLRATLPQQYIIKHEFPLDRVKDYVLHWPATEEHPRLFVTRQQAQRMRETFQADPNRLAQYSKNPVNIYEMDGPIAYYLGTGDPALGRHLAATAVSWMQGMVNMYLTQHYYYSFGMAPHQWKGSFCTALNLADAISDALTPEQRERVRAQAAFLGYVVQRPDYWSPARGFAANPNMSTFVAAFQTTIGCFISSHPLARTWVAQGLRELKDHELDTWSDANGGWLEAPHYAMASHDHLLACFLMARNAGFADHVFDPKMKKIIEWLAKISTPPDARLKGWRHWPPIGNTYKFEPSGEFGLVAGIWKERDPEFAAQMQWMFLQQGAQATPGVGGFAAAFAGYRGLLSDTNIAAQAPAYGSELFPETGVVLRNAYPSERETMLHMIVGSNYQHYDYDSGSITLWGKGRIVADEFGYQSRQPVADHSMVETPSSGGLDMRVKEFAPSQRFDYVRGALGGWTRQIAFVKDSDPLAPNYFVVCDTLSKPAPITWRLWLTCAEVTLDPSPEDVADALDLGLTRAEAGLGPQGALVAGREDVDTDVFFMRPAQVALQTEEKTRLTWGLNTNAHYGRTSWTQTGLIAGEALGRGFTVVLYPRLKTESRPKCAALADGQALRVQTPAGTDYVFLSAEPFSFREGDIAFEGTAGAIVTRGNQVILSLGAAGSIEAKKQTLKADKPAARVLVNFVESVQGFSVQSSGNSPLNTEH